MEVFVYIYNIVSTIIMLTTIILLANENKKLRNLKEDDNDTDK